MSHCTIIATEIKDLAALEAALDRLGISYENPGQVRFWNGRTVTGFVFKPLNWQNSVVLNEGGITYDNNGGAWGSLDELNIILQYYGVEKAKRMAKAKRYKYREETEEDGTIKLVVFTER